MPLRMTLRRNRLLRMVLAVLLTLLSVQLLGAEHARAETVTDGNYYADSPPTSGCRDAVSNRLVAFQDSKLFNRDTADCVGWEGSPDAPKSVTLVFDLLYDRPLGSISITSTATNTFWGFDEIEVTYRPEAGTAYRVAHSEAWDRSRPDYQRTVAMNNTQARFVRIKLTRVNQFLHFPLSEVTFTEGSGTVDPTPAPYTQEEMAAEVSVPTRLVDIYGQYLYGTWSGKLTSDQQLQQDGTDEAAALAGVTPDTTKYDQYGGVKALGSSSTESTGFFRLEKDAQGKWWFITPDNYKFILKGVDSTSATDWGYATVVKDSGGRQLGKFSALPDEATYAAAYSSDRKEMSFVKANLMRKYGATGWESTWRDITKKRLIKWGFNAQSKWSRDGGLQMPWIGQITAPAPDKVKRITSYAIDPFDPAFATELDKQLGPTTSIVRANANSPWLIGYYFDNERGWDDSVMTTMLNGTPTQYPAKAAFVAHMIDTYGLTETDNKLGTPGATQQELETRQLAGNVPTGSALRTEFIGEASKAYYSTVQAAIRKYDPNHLFLGSALVPGWRSTLAWEVCGREFVDAISLDVYSNSADYLDKYEPYDTPVLNLEHSFNVHDRGLRSINGSVRADDVADRGTMHQQFSWGQAESPVFVGSGWFSYYDQAVTGRASDGENYDFGLVNQQDQPYTAMTDVMAQTHQQLEQQHKTAPLPTTGTQSVCPD
ncbi:hypothetical protein [Streptomyces sp. NPDC005262]|uniref:hypothetical protein n=1 Tax=Streptomyces sp. NPDC005262 TaxID=3364710 RepID=UPI00369CABB1